MCNCDLNLWLYHLNNSGEERGSRAGLRQEVASRTHTPIFWEDAKETNAGFIQLWHRWKTAFVWGHHPQPCQCTLFETRRFRSHSGSHTCHPAWTRSIITTKITNALPFRRSHRTFSFLYARTKAWTYTRKSDSVRAGWVLSHCWALTTFTIAR